MDGLMERGDIVYFASTYDLGQVAPPSLYIRRSFVHSFIHIIDLLSISS